MSNAKPHPLYIQHDECPVCFNPLSCAGDATGRADRSPREGDLSICIQCGAFLAYGERLILQAATEDDLAELTPAQHEAMSAMRDFILHRNAHSPTPSLPHSPTRL